MRAVAVRADVSERTVFRHFGNERGLRDATMRRLEEQAGIDLEQLRLGDLPKVIGRVVEEIAAHPLEPRGPLDPTLSEVSRRQHAGLLAAVGAVAEDWPEEDRVVAAAVLDVLWGVATYERLAADWSLEPDRAVAGITWVASLVEEAVRAGRRPLAD